MKRNNVAILFLSLIFAIGLTVRFLHLGVIPPGLTDDEADKGYDAYSLIKTGRDQWGFRLPLVAFKGFGDYRSPLYTYLAVPSIAIFGLTPLAVRFPSALFGSLTIIVLYFFVSELFQDKRYATTLAILSSLILAISPWHIGMSRVASESTVGVFFVTLGLTMLFIARRSSRWFYVAALLFVLSIYTYPANIVFVPVIVVLLLLLFGNDYPKGFYIHLIFMFLLFVILCLPIVFSVTSAASVRIRQVNLTNDKGLIDLLNTKRGACTAYYSSQVCRIVFNKYYVYADKFLTNYFYHFSPNLLAITGSTAQFSILPPGGLLYMVELPLFVLGFLAMLRSRSVQGIFLMIYLLVAAVPDSITDIGHYGRYFISLPAWQIVIAFGIYTLATMGKKFRIFLVGIVFIYILECSEFAFEYMTYFPFNYSQFSHYGYKELVENIEMSKGYYDKIMVSGRVNDAKQYIFYLFYTRFDPKTFQQGRGVEKGLDSLGWVRVKQIGSVYFVQSLPPIEKTSVITDRELIIGAPSEFPQHTYIPIQFTIKDKKGDVLFQAVTAGDFIKCLRVDCSST